MARLLILAPAELTRDARARRAVGVAQERGFDVIGVCGRISGESPVSLTGISIVRVGRAARINRIWFGAPKRAEGRTRHELRALFRLGRLLLRSLRLWNAARRLPKADVVHANDLDTLPAAYLLARRWHARLVYDAHELYSEFDVPVPHAARALTLLVEGALARRAQSVVTVSDEAAEELRRLLRLSSKPLVVHNASRLAELDPAPAADDGPLRAVYQGGLGPGRELRDLLVADDAENVHLFIRIRMADPADLRDALRRDGRAETVSVLEPVEPADVLTALKGFDVGIIFDRPTSRNSELSVPNKFFDYLMAGLAVVAPHLETIGPLIANEKVGLTYDPVRERGLVEALEELAADRPRLAEMRVRARELAVTRLNAEAVADTLAEAWG